MFGKLAVIATLAAVMIPNLAVADPNVSEDAGQRYITIQTYWSDMSNVDRQAVVAEAVKQVQNEIAQKAPALNNPTLQNSLLSADFMNTLTAELTRYLDGVSGLEGSKYGIWRAAAAVLPKAVLITIGGSVGMHWVVGAKGSLDMGLVVMFPSFKTVIDTAKRDAQNQPSVVQNDQLKLFDAAIVGVPHAYAGLGVGAGGTFSIGVAGIWGNMSSASDFYGAIVAASAGLQLPIPAFVPDGGDLDIGLVANLHHVFGIARLSADKGAEASVTFDGEAGAVIPWQTLVSPSASAEGIKNFVTTLFSKKQSSAADTSPAAH
jgi:hypothetical protein